MLVSNQSFKFLNKLFSFIILISFPFLKLLYLIKPSPKNQKQKLLVSKLCCFGDSVLSLYTIDAIKKENPNLKITVISSSRTENIFSMSNSIDKTIVIPISGLKGLKETKKIFFLLTMYAKIFLESFDKYYDFDLYYNFTLPFSLLSGAKERKGFNTSWLRGIFYSENIQRPKDEAEYLCFYRFFDNTNKFKFKILDIKTNTSDKLFADKLLENITKPIVIIIPGGSLNWPQKRWPLINFIELINILNEKYSAEIIIAGSKDERTLVDEIKHLSEIDLLDICGKTSPAKLSEIIKKSQLMISNDTGPLHLSAACNVPSIGIYGPTNEKKWSSPGPNFRVAKFDIDCRPCYYMSSMKNCAHISCLKKINAQEIAELAGEFLK